jgi:aldehyde:ferredoxin oxidoreductase
MLGGYWNKFLRVNLESGECTCDSFDEKVLKQYIGGAGLASCIIYDETDADTEPFSSRNPLIFMTGPLTATAAPTSGRFIVAGISPLTGIWGEAHGGGAWGYELKRAGYDGLIITGVARDPVYLFIENDQVEIRDASVIWGTDTYTGTELIREQTHPDAKIAIIGQAGERLVRFASILSGGKEGRAAGRCGMGALMGSKRLKGIAVKGTTRPAVSDAEALAQSVNRFMPKVKIDWDQYEAKHRRLLFNVCERGFLPVQNFVGGEFPSFHEKFVETMTEGEHYYCRGCWTSCGESGMLPEGRRPLGQSIPQFGSQCLIDDMAAVKEAYFRCNQYGMDSISAGGAVSFAMEAYGKGLIDQRTIGLPLTWGAGPAMVEMVKMIGLREGFGKLLGEGVKRAAEEIGGMAPEYAMHVKGLEFPAWDPRASYLKALEFATANEGATHLSGYTLPLTRAPFPDLGIMEIVESPERRFTRDGRAAAVIAMQNYMGLLDSLVSCKFLLGSNCAGQVIMPSHFLEWLNHATGWKIGLDEFLLTGERIFNLKRLINCRRGISRKDDTLPPRFLTVPRGAGITEDKLPPLHYMLWDYYKLRGWREEGIPSQEKLAQLNLAS